MSPTWLWRTRSWSTGIFSSSLRSFLKAGESVRCSWRPLRRRRNRVSEAFPAGKVNCPSVSPKFGAQSKRNDAQNLLGLFGGSAERGSAFVWTRHQTRGRDQRGKDAMGGGGVTVVTVFHVWLVGQFRCSKIVEQVLLCTCRFITQARATPVLEGRIPAGCYVLPGRTREMEA